MNYFTAKSRQPLSYEYLSIRIDPLWLHRNNSQEKTEHAQYTKCARPPSLSTRKPPQRIPQTNIIYPCKVHIKKIKRIELYQLKLSNNYKKNTHTPLGVANRNHPISMVSFRSAYLNSERPNTANQLHSRPIYPYIAYRPRSSMSQFKSIHVFMPPSPKISRPILI
jgi:hypothetical protein